MVFDNWYTQPGFCRYLDKTLRLPYVGTLADNDNVLLKSGRNARSIRQQLKQEHLAAMNGGPATFKPITNHYKGEKERYYSYCATHRIQSFGRQRLVINHREADLSDGPVFFISNRLIWQSPGITRIRRHRWPVEVYHEEGKAEGLTSIRCGTFKPLNDTSAGRRRV